MKIISEEIELRAIEYSDKELLMELINDPNIEYGLGGWSYPVSDREQEEWINNLKNEKNVFRAIIIEKNSDTPVGTAILSDIDFKNGNSEIHIKIRKDFQGKKIGSKVISLLSKYAFEELRLNCLYAHITSYNISSQKIFEKNGFILDGRLRERIFKNGRYNDIFVYSLLYRDVHEL